LIPANDNDAPLIEEALDVEGRVDQAIEGALRLQIAMLQAAGIPDDEIPALMRAGQPYVVGERRAELFVPNQSGRIIPHLPSIPNMAGMGAGRQGNTVNVRQNITVAGNGDEALKSAMRIAAAQGAAEGAKIAGQQFPNRFAQCQRNGR
jgi:hypothetical protein